MVELGITGVSLLRFLFELYFHTFMLVWILPWEELRRKGPVQLLLSRDWSSGRQSVCVAVTQNDVCSSAHPALRLYAAWKQLLNFSSLCPVVDASARAQVHWKYKSQSLCLTVTPDVFQPHTNFSSVLFSDPSCYLLCNRPGEESRHSHWRFMFHSSL